MGFAHEWFNGYCIDAYRLGGGGFGVTVTTREQSDYMRLSGTHSENLYISDPEVKRYASLADAVAHGKEIALAAIRQAGK